MWARTKLLVASAVIGLSMGGLAGCGEEPAPRVITYQADVQPLLAARCVRCHGAGGTLNADPGISQSWVNKFGDGKDHRVPKSALLNTLDGAKAARESFPTYLRLPMPPPPFPALTAREKEILLNWDGT